MLIDGLYMSVYLRCAKYILRTIIYSVKNKADINIAITLYYDMNMQFS